jgi:hypothetical protein
MHVRTVRRPGEPGTRRLLEKYGDRLVCTRYRYDPAKQRRYETVELVIAEELWIPPPDIRANGVAPIAPERRYTPRVPVRINYHEKDLQRQIKAIGGTWEPTKKLWYAPEEYVRRIGLDKRIVRCATRDAVAY